MNSFIYTGWVRHQRLLPRRHKFSYRLFMMYLDLGELDQVFRGRWFWSSTRRSLAWFRREDHFGDPRLPLDTCVRDLVERETGRRPSGPIRLLTHLRYFGYCLNPISIYYCFDNKGRKVQTVVAEVTNTPWGERCCYVLDQHASRTDKHHYHFDKTMHVSPFMPMNLHYAWYNNEPGPKLNVHMALRREGERLFDATLSLRRRPIAGRSLASVLLFFPLMTVKVVAAIYWQALRLWLKQVPIFDHSAKRENPLEG